MNVDRLFQNLVDIHGVDAAALEAELVGQVRTPDYPAKGSSRRILESLPAGFPRFRGVANAHHLVVERMRFPNDTVYQSTASSATLSIARPPALPATILVGLRGRSVTDFVECEGLDASMRIISVQSSDRRQGGIKFDTLDISLDMPTTRLTGVGRELPAPNPPLPSEILEPHMRRYGDDVAEGIVEALDPLDPREWHDVFDYHGAIFGLRVEERRGSDHLVLRFPYDKAIVDKVGQGGFGAWYDRSTWAWCIAPQDLDADAMVEALRSLEPVFILDQEGAVYGPRA